MKVRKIKKITAVICGIIIILLSYSYCLSSKAENLKENNQIEEIDDWLEVNELNFPDSNLRSIILNVDYNGNGKINPDKYSNFYLNNCNISSLKGLEYFNNIKYLDVSNNSITSIDADIINKLEYLDISFNPIKNIDVSSNPFFTEGDCYNIYSGPNGSMGSMIHTGAKLYIDSTQSVASIYSVKYLIIKVPEKKGSIDLNNIKNYNTNFLIGIDKADNYIKLDYNSDSNKLYYDFSDNINNSNFEEKETFYDNPYYDQPNVFCRSNSSDDEEGIVYECLVSYTCNKKEIEEYTYESEAARLEIIYNDGVSYNSVPIQTSGIYCASTSPSIVAGLVIDNKSDISADIEYQWLVCDESTGAWSVASDWTKNNEYMNYTPSVSGNYIFVCKARIVGNPDSEVSASFGTPYTKTGGIKQICQMPYEGGGYLIGFESYENPNQEYQYEMFVMDLSLLAAGSPTPWVHATGKITLAAGSTPEEGKTMWTIWQPQYGYYLTLFRLYDKDGNMIDEVPYGFANAY